MVSELLQISDSNISDNSFEYAYQRNYKKLTKVKKRQKNNNNEYEGDNEAVQSLRIGDVSEGPDVLQTAIQMCNTMQTSLDSFTVMIFQPEIMSSRNTATTDNKVLYFLH
ncbi:hypothetical protein F8M41_009645 [Gigaspora margarita]|uniref:Uncharacterized protein n=1 Tax=Gigaspora margarita TaxID=4874 RepID=A0A8H4AUY6_GIGMA|nr:hypothetical protein F8M41_009645 [Gigaspora margarita]